MSDESSADHDSSDHDSSDHEERRSSPRVEKINLVQVSRFDEEGFRADLAAGRTVNLSRGGVRIELHHSLPLRSEVRIDVAVGEQVVGVDGKVVHLQAVGEDRCEIGIAFENLDAETEALIAEYIDD
ncbi:MAG: PilZ domain-containing protein [Acidobacteriota bacterium]